MGRSSPAAGMLVALLHPPPRTSRSVEPLLMGLVGGLLPALSAMRLRPLESMR